MKQMIQKMREEKDGFTLAELLVVVAIIAVLVAIAIPVFTSQLAKAEAATDEANCRSYYASATVQYMTDKTVPTAGTLDTIPSYDGTQAYEIKQGNLVIDVTGDTVTFTYNSNIDEHDWKGSFNKAAATTQNP